MMRLVLLPLFSIHRVILSVLLCSSSCLVVAQQPQPTFDVASVRVAQPDADPRTGSWSRPGIDRFTASHVTLARLIQLAYGIDEDQIANKPGWIDINLYDVEAKPQEGVSLTREELRPCLQKLLQDRFHLAAHTETRFGHGYALMIGQTGLKLKPASVDHFAGERHPVSPGHLHTFNCSMRQLAQYLSLAVGIPVADQTGLTASYDIDFDYNPNPDADSDFPPLELALKQATGLVLKMRRVPIEMLVIDSIDKVPTPN